MSEQSPSYNVTFKTEKDFDRAIKSEVRRLGKLRGTEYSGPDPSLIRELFKYSNWTQTYGADVLRVDVSSLRRWMANREQKQSREIPYCAWFLLLLLSGKADLDSI